MIDLAVLKAGYAPVKGTAHRPHDVVELTPDGVVGDRRLCLVDLERRAVLRTVRHPRLLAVLARHDGDVLELEVPGAPPLRSPVEPTDQTVTCDYWGRPVTLSLLAGPHADLLVNHLVNHLGNHLGGDLARLRVGGRVVLAAAPPGAIVFGGATITVVGTASLRDLGRRAGRDLIAESARFRATLVVETEEPYVEETWLGRDLRAGTAILRGGVPIPRCALIDHSPATGHKDARLLRTLAGYRPRNRSGEPVFGAYAEVAVAGHVHPPAAGLSR